MNSNLRNNLNLIEKDVNILMKNINCNDKIFERSLNTDVNINGYHDPMELYRGNVNDPKSLKLTRDDNLLKEQQRRYAVPTPDNKRLKSKNNDIVYEIDNRKELYPNSEINNYKDQRNAVIENNNGTSFKYAPNRGNVYPSDVLLNEKDKVKKNRKEKFQDETKIRRSSENRDNRKIYYPDQKPSSESDEDSPVSKVLRRARSLEMPKIELNNEVVYERKNTGDVFTHNSERDRVPINSKDLYKGSTYEATPYNDLDQEVTYDKRKEAINKGEINFPTGTVFTHGQQRDRVPIVPTQVYRNSDYKSNEYNQLDMDVDRIPRKAMIDKTVDYMLNREFDVVNDNVTSKDERNEKTIIHAPYTPLDEFGQSDVVFKNINEKKPQVDVLNEFIVNIDSADRNPQYYPNQFSLRVLFNAGDPGYITGTDGKKKAASGTADLKILRSFENIKYLRLETATLPRYYSLIKTEDKGATPQLGSDDEKEIIKRIIDSIHNHEYTSTQFQKYIYEYTYTPPPPSTIVYVVQFVAYTAISPTNVNAKFNIVYSRSSYAYEIKYNDIVSQTITTRYEIDKTKDLSKDRYTMINLDEITDNTQNSTSGKNQYNYLYPDYVTDKYFYGDNHFVDKIFKNAKLGEIKNLTITLSDSFANPIISGQHIDIVDSTKDTLSTTDNPSATTVYNDSISYIRHPYYRDFQLTLMFKIGVYETDIDKKIFY